MDAECARTESLAEDTNDAEKAWVARRRDADLLPQRRPLSHRVERGSEPHAAPEVDAFGFARFDRFEMAGRSEKHVCTRERSMRVGPVTNAAVHPDDIDL